MPGTRREPEIGAEDMAATVVGDVTYDEVEAPAEAAAPPEQWSSIFSFSTVANLTGLPATFPPNGPIRVQTLGRPA